LAVTNSSNGTLTTIVETGSTVGLFTVHATAKADSGGAAASNGGTAVISCGATSAATVKSCTFDCSTAISINGTANGVGATINFPTVALWNDQWQAKMDCQPLSSKSTTAGGGGGGGGCDPTVGDCGTCTTVPIVGGPTGEFKTECDPGTSPIIIDVDGHGFRLTDAGNGVSFDIRGDGHPIQIAWTASGAQNAFLALPGPDALVHNGKELFGNFTPQPQSAHPNGFLALAEFDKPENGGNGDGVIDEHDAVFSQLRLWIDENHDGVSQQNELHALPELGIYSLSLSYFESRRKDEFGNQFRYKARVNPGTHRDPHDETPSGEPRRWAYDVFLATH